MLKKAIYPRNLHCRSLPMGSINQRLESNALQMLLIMTTDIAIQLPKVDKQTRGMQGDNLKICIFEPTCAYCMVGLCLLLSICSLYVTEMKEKYSNPAYQHSYFARKS